jgi:hypothetical protein
MISGTIRKYLLCTAISLAVPFFAHAADIGCGRDTDRNGSVDNYCTGDDADFDGYTTAQGDCDDNNWQVYPGISVATGCSAGQYRTCKAAGTGWTSCVSTSTTPYCPNSADTTTHAGKVALNCYYIDPVSGNDANAGTYASPWQTLGKISFNVSGRHAPSAGDAFILLGGSYARHANPYLGYDITMYNRSVSGTATNPIWVINYPGAAPVFDDVAAETASVYNYLTDYWIFSGIEIDGNDVGGKLLLVDGDATTANPNYTVLQNMYIHNVDCTRSDDGSCGMKIQGGTGTGDIVGVTIRNSFWADNIDQEDAGGDGSYSIGVFRAKDLTIENNVIVASSPTGATGVCTKHSNANSSQTIRGNYFSGFTAASGSIQAVGIGAPATTINNNLFVGSGLTIRDFGGARYVKDVLIENNTFTNVSRILAGTIDRGYDEDGTSAADTCSGDYYGDVTIQKNIITSNAASYPAEGRLYEISTYGSDANFATWVTGGLLQVDQNCYYNTLSTALAFGLYASNNADTSCTGRGNNGQEYSWAQWQSAGYDAAGFNENPTLSATLKATSTNCEAWGYRNSITDATSIGIPPMLRNGYYYRRVLR